MEQQQQFVSNSPPIAKIKSSYTIDWDNLDESSNPFDSNVKVEKKSIDNIPEKPVDHAVDSQSKSSVKPR